MIHIFIGSDKRRKIDQPSLFENLANIIQYHAILNLDLICMSAIMYMFALGFCEDWRKTTLE